MSFSGPKGLGSSLNKSKIPRLFATTEKITPMLSNQLNATRKTSQRINPNEKLAIVIEQNN